MGSGKSNDEEKIVEGAYPKTQEKPHLARGPLFRGAIRTKILTLVVFSTMVPALLIGVLFYVTARQLLVESVTEQLSARAASAARLVNEWFAERANGSRVFARSDILTRALGDSNTDQGLVLAKGYLSEVLGRSPDAVSIFILSDSGDVLAQAGLLAGVHAETYRQRESATGIFDLMESADGLLVFTEGRIALEGRRTSALLVTASSLDGLARDLRELNGEKNDLALGVFGPNGESLAPSLTKGGCCEFIHMPREQGEPLVEYTNSDNRAKAAVYDIVAAENLELTVVVEADSEAAFARINDLRIVNIGVGTGVLILFLGLGVLLVRQLTGPLEALTAGAEAISRGELDTEIEARVGGEIGILTNVFNRMARNLKASHEALEHQSVTDELTSLWNRRQMNRAFESELARAERTDQPLSVIAIDVDHFKDFNDRFGHLRGDEMLAFLGEFLRNNVRPTDVAARFGGEEFILILPGATLDEAYAKAEDIRKSFAELTKKEQIHPVTLSAGVSCWPEHGATSDALIDAADQALYAAKSGGRNQVELAAVETAKG